MAFVTSSFKARRSMSMSVADPKLEAYMAGKVVRPWPEAVTFCRGVDRFRGRR